VNILVSDCYSFVSVPMNLDQDFAKLEAKNKDLRLKVIKDEKKTYDSYRKASCLPTGASYAISDINDSEMMTVGSVSTLYDLLKMFSNYHPSTNGKE
jgi:hypothetical protein